MYKEVLANAIKFNENLLRVVKIFRSNLEYRNIHKNKFNSKLFSFSDFAIIDLFECKTLKDFSEQYMFKFEDFDNKICIFPRNLGHCKLNSYLTISRDVFDMKDDEIVKIIKDEMNDYNQREELQKSKENINNDIEMLKERISNFNSIIDKLKKVEI